MNRRPDEQDEGRADRLVSRLWRSVAPPGADELQDLARKAVSENQRADRRTPFRARRRVRARWAVAVAAAALLVGSGLGFGLGSTVTPSGSAGRNVVGFGFLPDRGWTVVQAGGPGPGATTAIASHVPLRPGDGAGGLSSTLAALPKHGVVLAVTSTPRGDPAEDVAFPIRDLPLEVGDGRASSSADRTHLRLRAGVGGYNVDARIFFGAAPPTASMLATAQRQLNRLVIAADRVTIAVRPTVSSPLTGQVTVFGTIDSGRAGESVTVQAKDCGATFFRVYAGASTEAGGGWSTFIFPFVTTTLRALWNGETSTEVVFRQRAYIGLRQQSPTRFSLLVSARSARFAGRRASIQRFDQRLGRWETVKSLTLASDRFPGTKFTLRVPRGTRLRAVFANSQARPCYLGATSPVIRT